MLILARPMGWASSHAYPCQAHHHQTKPYSEVYTRARAPLGGASAALPLVPAQHRHGQTGSAAPSCTCPYLPGRPGSAAERYPDEGPAVESLRAVANTRAHEHSTDTREALEWQVAVHSSLSLGVGQGYGYSSALAGQAARHPSLWLSCRARAASCHSGRRIAWASAISLTWSAEAASGRRRLLPGGLGVAPSLIPRR